MKFVVLGTSKFTAECARALLDSGEEICALISMPHHAQPENSFDLRGFAKERGVHYFEFENINSPESIHLIKSFEPDYLFSSWPKMIDKQVFEIPRLFCIGSHPTDLPHNRGRHPLHWMIVLGISESRLSFFRMDSGVDTGNILLKVPFTVESSDSMGRAVERMNVAAYQGIRKLSEMLRADPTHSGIPQNGSANYWRMRTPHDVIIDFRMSADAILRTVQSFTLPYSCAMILFEKQIIRIANAGLSKTYNALPLSEIQRIEHGTILKIAENIIWVKADDAIVRLESINQVPALLNEKKYIHPPTKYFISWGDDLSHDIFRS